MTTLRKICGIATLDVDPNGIRTLTMEMPVPELVFNLLCARTTICFYDNGVPINKFQGANLAAGNGIKDFDDALDDIFNKTQGEIAFSFDFGELIAEGTNPPTPGSPVVGTFPLFGMSSSAPGPCEFKMVIEVHGNLRLYIGTWDPL